MKITLINPCPRGSGLNESTVEPPVGLAYMAAVLEGHQFQCALIDANVLRLSVNEVLSRIDFPDSKIIGLHVNSFLYDVAMELCVRIRNARPDAIVLLGGPVPTAAPEETLKDFPCSAVVMGEGEYALLRIAENVRRGCDPFAGEVSGLVYRAPHDLRTIIKNPVQRIADLDALPFPAYHLLPPFSEYKSRSRRTPVAPIITSRGCPYGCSFCSKDVFQRKITSRSAENVLREVDHLVRDRQIRQIDILDDNFTQDQRRLHRILDGLLARKYDLALNIQTGIRVESLDEETLKKMKAAGFFKLAFGVESANQEVLRIHHKSLDLEKLVAVVKSARQLGFVTYGFFIIGLPGETDAAFEETLEFAKKAGFDIANFCMAIPFVGTELYRMIEERGRFLIDTRKNIAAGFYGGEVFFTYDGCTEQQISARYQRAYRGFYTFRKQLGILAAIRSARELLWVIGSFLFVVKGLFHRRTGRIC